MRPASLIVGLSTAIGGAGSYEAEDPPLPPKPTSERGRLMSNEERNDEMVDETSEAEESETGEEEYSYAGRNSTSGGSSGGSSAGIWVIIILVIAALIGVGAWQWSQQQAEAKRKAQEEREQIRQRQLGIINEDVQDAAEALKAGNVDVMIERLQEANEQLDILAKSANSSGDIEAAQRITAKKTAIQKAIKSLQPIYDEIEAKRAELAELENQLRETAQTSLQSVSAEFGGASQDAEATEDETPADEEAAADEAADGEAADGEATDGDAARDEESADDQAAEDAEADEAPASPEADEDVPAGEAMDPAA